ncbi:MAG: Fic family protein [Elusimicrobia bacterium]|nr:Fic family protein [Elusimicrobiota bacterium]
MIKDRLTKRLENISGKEAAALFAKIAKMDEFKGWWKGAAALSPQILNRLKQSVVVTSSGASTRIEGSRLSDKEVERLLRGLKMSKLKDRDSQEVASYAELLRIVFESYRSMKFNEGLILQFHSLVLKYSEKDQRHRGKYKDKPNKVLAHGKGRQSVVFEPTPPHLTPLETRELVDWTQEQLINSSFHPLLIIANFVLEFLAIHPFEDGNGRLSRILTNLLLLRSGYAYVPYASLDKITEDRKTEYYVALRRSQKEIRSPKANIAPWLHFFLDILLIQIEILQEFLKERPVEKMLSENQLNALKLFERYEEISAKTVARDLKIPHPTARQILERLLTLKLIERVGLGRATRYRKIN